MTLILKLCYQCTNCYKVKNNSTIKIQGFMCHMTWWNKMWRVFVYGKCQKRVSFQAGKISEIDRCIVVATLKYRIAWCHCLKNWLMCNGLVSYYLIFMLRWFNLLYQENLFSGYFLLSIRDVAHKLWNYFRGHLLAPKQDFGCKTEPLNVH